MADVGFVVMHVPEIKLYIHIHCVQKKLTPYDTLAKTCNHNSTLQWNKVKLP